MAKHVFVHIGDAHIGPGPRLADKLGSLDQIIIWVDRLAEEGQLAAILWPGDLFHAKSTIEDRNLLAPRLQRLAQRAPVVLLDGNHDAPGDLEILSRLSSYYPIHVVSQPKVLAITCATGATAAIACLPYPHRAGLVGAGVAHEDLGQVARQLLEPVFMQFAHELEAARFDLTLFVGHVNVGGSVASTGQPQIGREIELDPSLLARLGPVYKGLNHIHRHQEIAGAVYAGSISRQDFGESERKGFVIATADTVKLVDAIDWTWTFVPLDVPSQLLVEGRLTRQGFQFDRINGEPVCEQSEGQGWYQGTGSEHHPNCDGSCRDCPVPVPIQVACPCAIRALWTGSDIRVRYHYKKSETGTLDTAHILAEFAGCRSLKLDPIAELEHSVRAPEVAAAVTLDAKVEAYFTRREIPFTPSVAAKLAALQQQPAEQLLAQASRPSDAPAPAERAVA